MKKFLSILSFSLIVFFLQNCSSQTVTEPQVLTNIINNEEFTFHAQKANPTNYDVIRAMNSIPNATSSRVLDLNSDAYVIEVTKEKVDVVLPYFGRIFNPTFGNIDKNSYRFTSKKFTLTKTQNKKGNWNITISPKDVDNVSEIYINVYKSGKALVSIKSSDRQPISYDGYISKKDVR